MEPEAIDPQDLQSALGSLGPQTVLLVAPRRALRAMIGAAAARLALAGPVRVLDGGNLYDAHAIARRIRREIASHRAESSGRMRDEQALEHIRVARAFTCYQVEALLAAQIALPMPTLILDILSTFADETAPLKHRHYLMEQILGHLTRLARSAPVLVGAAPAEDPPLDIYLGWLAGEAQRVLRYEIQRPPDQPPLF